MEKFSNLFGFLTILKESIKILPKNGKFMALIATLSLVLPSILILLFSYFSLFLISDMKASYTKPGSTIYRMLIYWALILAVEIAFLLIYFIISHLSGIATILVSANSYSSKNLTIKDLVSSIKRAWKSPFRTSFRASQRSPTQYLSIPIIFATFLVVTYPNFITISIAITLGIPVLLYQLYLSVVWALSVVVSVVEDCSRMEALEKAEKLVLEGQHLHGFMLNLLINLLGLSIMLVCWIILGDTGSLNLTIYGLFFLNFISLFKMLIFVAYTVFYFQCKKHHGEARDIIGVVDLQYSQLPTTALGNDIP